MQGLRTAIYKVDDLAQAKSWYSQAFDTQPYFDEPYYVGYDIGGYELGLQLVDGAYKERLNGVIAYWGVEDIDLAYNRLISLGAVENEKPFSVGGEIVTATVFDPFGNLLGLIYNPGFRAK